MEARLMLLNNFSNQVTATYSDNQRKYYKLKTDVEYVNKF